MERYRLGSNIICASEILHSNRHVVAWVSFNLLSYANVWQSRSSHQGNDDAQFHVSYTDSAATTRFSTSSISTQTQWLSSNLPLIHRYYAQIHQHTIVNILSWLYLLCMFFLGRASNSVNLQRSIAHPHPQSRLSCKCIWRRVVTFLRLHPFLDHCFHNQARKLYLEGLFSTNQCIVNPA